MDIKPLGTRIIVKQKELPSAIGMIYIPETSKELIPTEGKIVAIGDKVTKVKVNDSVYYGRYAGFIFERNRERYTFLDEDDVLGLVMED